MIPIAISTTFPDGGEYARAVAAAGGLPTMLRFDPAAIDGQLVNAGGVLISGGGDVDPSRYGAVRDGATEIDEQRDEFELALVRRARELGMPTLCICRGLQVANVAFGGTLVVDIGSAYGAATAARHRLEVDGAAERGLITGHDVAIRAGTELAAIAGTTSLVTGSRHHQSIARPAADLDVVAATADGIVEAAGARFDSPFWLGVQWHPESTVALDGGASRAIFGAFIAAARRAVQQV